MGFSLMWFLTCTESVCELLPVFHSLPKPLFMNYKIVCGGSKVCPQVAGGPYAGSELHSSHLGHGGLGDSLLTKTIWQLWGQCGACQRSLQVSICACSRSQQPHSEDWVAVPQTDRNGKTVASQPYKNLKPDPSCRSLVHNPSWEQMLETQ